MSKRGGNPIAAPEEPLYEPLTRRESEILALLSQDLTARQIASKLSIAHNSAKWYIQEIYGKLGVSSKAQALERARQLGLLGSGMMPAHKHNLPRQLTRFIGREEDISQIDRLLSASTLVTLTGSGGVGKTRLALMAAEKALNRYPDGVWLVELASISDHDLVPHAAATSLGLREEADRPILETLMDFLRDKKTLIVLDNCEHLIAACASLVERLLQTCPRLILLVTSREALGVGGEMTYRVPSLSFPDPQALPSPDVLGGYEAVRLFVERAQAVLPGFQATERNAAAIARICQRLDGIPFAIELAVARLNLLTAEQLASRLEHAFDLLIGGSRTALPRHQTLRATIDWSYALLTEAERVLLRRLSVFVGGWTLEEAEAITGGREEGIEVRSVLDLLGSLVNKSIVIAERKPGAEARYRLLVTVRQYAHEKLVEAGESEATHDRHLEYFLGFIEKANHVEEGITWVEKRTKISPDQDNLRAAIEWAYSRREIHIAGDRPEIGLRMAVAIGRNFAGLASLYTETRHWLLTGINALGDRPEVTHLRAQALGVLGWLALSIADWSAGLQWYGESIRLCRDVGQTANADLSYALWGYAHIAGFGENDAETALKMADESVTVARTLGGSPDEKWFLAYALTYKARIFTFFSPEADLISKAEAEEVLQHLQPYEPPLPVYWTLGKIAEHAGDHQEGLRFYEEALVRSQLLHGKTVIAITHRYLSLYFYHQGIYSNALEHNRKYLAGWHEMGNRLRSISGLIDAGIFLSAYASRLPTMKAARPLRQAAVLFGAVKKAAGDSPIPIFPEENYDFDGALEALHARMEEEEFTRAWGEGYAMTLDEAVNIALAIRISRRG